MRTMLLFGLLTALFLAIGYFFGGTSGMFLGLVFAFVINFLTYWYSDKIVLMMYRAKPFDNPELKKIIKELSEKAEIPEPRLYVVDMNVPNAFATGRSPKHSAVCITKGLLNTLNTKEVRGVLAHEISHIKNRDTLVQVIAATMAGALTWLGYIFWFGDERNRNIFSYILLFILAPLAALLIKLAISRTREYNADKTGATISGDPLGLASALEKISGFVKHHPVRGNASTSHLFIVNPFRTGGIQNLFSTHPPVQERVRRLREM